MGRSLKLSKQQVEEIRTVGKSKTLKDIASTYGISIITAMHARNSTGPYRQHVLDLGTPVLDSHGNTVGVAPITEILEAAQVDGE